MFPAGQTADDAAAIAAFAQREFLLSPGPGCSSASSRYDPGLQELLEAETWPKSRIT
jgi:hypothetical protein